jgi:hypothetical protein
MCCRRDDGKADVSPPISSPDNHWVVIEGQVVDVTQWISRHPGGAQPLLQGSLLWI